MTSPTTDALLSTRDAAMLWGCKSRGFSQRMARWGFQAVVRPGTTYRGGRSYWWHPADVMRARAMARADATRAATEAQAKADAEAASDEATRVKRQHLAILRRHYAQERWRRYWTAKDQARQANRQVGKQAAQRGAK